jgi:hypothetical protein
VAVTDRGLPVAVERFAEAVGLLAAVVLFAEAVGLLAGEVRVVLAAVRPLAVAFERAVAVRAAVVRELPLLGALDVFRDGLLLLRAELPLRADELRAVVLRAEELLLLLPVVFLAVLFRAGALLRLRPAVDELFFAWEVRLADERLLLVAAAPFLPAELFFAAVLRDELPPDERELELDFLVPLFLVPLEDLELEAFFAPPDEDRDDDELFFEALLLLDDERERLDFFVVAIQIIPPIIFGVFLHYRHLAICVPFCVLYQVKTDKPIIRKMDSRPDRCSNM